MADAKAVDGDLGVIFRAEGEKLIGKHVRPHVGQMVRMSQQGLDRRKDAGRSDPSRGGIGTVVRVNANWTCDVKWHLTNQTREGYAAGSVCTGGKTRAFHLAALGSDSIIPAADEPSEKWQHLNLESQRAKYPIPAENSGR
eukprot:CAMPEP_0181290362 /NCGR_PEP_ID=MMETSP1101-20121128/1373_1 /TAXON_ID=46948 /ORGANISM="Rhodomonas abbreviata, Strain Caron Lab Isolate" /LENGTH=140 /DNA_ID=CAMNT_0023394641 /DNA_START=14 /DNA_END=436 /DNA_ORIENTATION=-